MYCTIFSVKKVFPTFLFYTVFLKTNSSIQIEALGIRSMPYIHIETIGVHTTCHRWRTILRSNGQGLNA